MGRVEGKVALITGGASGLGAADARLLAAEGAKVVITDVQGDMGAATAASIPGALFLQHDVRDEQQWQDVVAKTLDHFGRLDVLVNNCYDGGKMSGKWWENDAADAWDRPVTVGLRSM